MKLKLNKQTWIWPTVLFTFFVLFSYFSFSPQPKVFPEFVSDSPAPNGVKGFYTYVKKNSTVKRWDYTPGLLPKQSRNNLLMMIGPSFTPEKEEMDAYLQFMRAGNTILLLDRNPKGMFELDTVTKKSDEKPVKLRDQHGHTFKVAISSQVRLRPQKGDIVLLKDKEGPVAIKRKVGQGQLVMVLAPEWVTNDQILEQDHLSLILQLMNESKANSILFDEYLHGSENAATFLTVYPKWLILLIFQGMIVTLLWLWYKGKRFGPILVAREETVRFSDEGIQALSAWYLRGRRFHDALLIQADYVKLLLQEKWGIPYTREWQDLGNLLERKWQNMPSKEVHTYLNDLTSMLKKEKISKQEFLLWSRNLDQLRKEVEEG
ncbi:DUF4350 domain-containing protein [Neobacillus sp. LXY-1]|uniref:DUF4350 domain-containing protein n=1 Tax=Neobacillus sp. LXY-1 TaxID=3379133 RepID=UPI003EE10F31